MLAAIWDTHVKDIEKAFCGSSSSWSLHRRWLVMWNSQTVKANSKKWWDCYRIRTVLPSILSNLVKWIKWLVDSGSMFQSIFRNIRDTHSELKTGSPSLIFQGYWQCFRFFIIISGGILQSSGLRILQYKLLSINISYESPTTSLSNNVKTESRTLETSN